MVVVVLVDVVDVVVVVVVVVVVRGLLCSCRRCDYLPLGNGHYRPFARVGYPLSPGRECV